MIQISLCMIVRDEEDVIGRCLESVRDVFDEIIIVDTGSIDRTKEIAAQYTSNIYDFKWIDDFSAARNFSFSKASCPYCMWLDADDILMEKDKAALVKLKESLSGDIDIVMLPYHISFDQNGNPLFSYFRERIVKKKPILCWNGAVHEAITPSGKIIYENAAVTHSKIHPSDPDRNLRIFEKQIADGIMLVPREQFYYGRELYYHKRYQDAITVFQAMLDEGKAWVENSIEACRFQSYCYYKLSEDRSALAALFHSLEFDIPRAEICCDIGKHFMDRTNYQLAIYWYQQALNQKRNDTSGAFVSPDCYDYVPCIQLCVCFDRMGDREKAITYNKMAGIIKPKDPAYLSNKKYFEKNADPQK